ncbi:sporulation membrane protein YtaF [Paenalkalicoccus suaedae]|uniref:Sporulation membrane protein YtaF n=1 Tax=Paenalkalicoccus suaedae TaxID=2592382 RepID=A0A859FIG5_9BACI|nr:sporulation membrane protein YtaF [Paenalkalicoccus suaedae]QKS72025.1 sporulation membrane protein YtaF [Paenalkalicoccus suaedae]
MMILLALAVSLDSFGVGFTYGLRKMRVPFKSILVIGAFSGVAAGVAFIVGRSLFQFISPTVVNQAGAYLLLALGIVALLQASRPSELKKHEMTIPFFGLVVTVLRTPMQADMDKSGSISVREACLLGTALALDAAGAGVVAATQHYSWIFPVIVGGLCVLFLTLGKGLGLRCEKALGFATYIPGLLLILLACLKL